MPKDTPSMAKNKMRRSLLAIYDPPPSNTEVNQLWNYFESRCTYCGVEIERKSRTGHLDHLVSSPEGGRNNIHSHALSCARCNGDEKREEPWDSFLAKKAESSSGYNERKTKIENWLALAPHTITNKELIDEAEVIIKEALANFEHAVNKMRVLRNKSTQPVAQADRRFAAPA